MQFSKANAIAVMGTLALLLTMGGLATASANTINSCTVVGSTTISVPASGSTTVKVTVTYSDFSAGNYPMYITGTTTTGYTINASSNYYDGSSGSHTFTLKITNTNPSVSTGSATLKVNWTPSGGVTEPITCTTLTLNTHTLAPPPGVPQFPYGMALLMALAIPALLLVRKAKPLNASI
jgi:hypothetical protein